MQRLRLYDCRTSRLPRVIGYCENDIHRIADAVNTAQRRLLYAKEAGEEGWWGTWAEILFFVSRAQPYITLPRDIARIESANVCGYPVTTNNQFVEYLRFGNGRMPKSCSGGLGIHARNNAVTFTDLTNGPQFITAMISNPADATKVAIIQGLDENENQVYTLDFSRNIQGQKLFLDVPMVTTPQTFTSLNGIQKDQTIGQVSFYQTDPTTGDQVLLLTMEPSELTASYRRYYIDPLPTSCCATATGVQVNPVAVTAIVKMDLVPVQTDTDYCMIQNLEAIIEECQSIRLSECDTPGAKQMAAERHIQAIRMLNGELGHYMGLQQPAILFSPFGSARLECQKIGSLM